MILFLACTELPSERQWLQEQFVKDNLIWVSRDSELLEAKFKEMASSSYAYMRGSLAVHLADATRVRSGREHSTFLNSPQSVAHLQLGDPHLENLSVYWTKSQGSVEWSDLDAVSFLPWNWDVRRSGLSLMLISDYTGCSCGVELVDKLLDGYFEALNEDSKPFEEARFLRELLDEAEEEGLEQKKLHKYTSEGAFVLDEILSEEGKGLFKLSAEEHKQCLRLWSSLDVQGQILDCARRYGMGVSSRPALRYAVLFEDSDQIQHMILIREVMDPPAALQLSPVWSSNVERIESNQWIWSNVNADPFYLGVEDGDVDFKSVSWSSKVQAVDRDKILEAWQEGELSKSELQDLAKAMGVMLAQTHQKVPNINGLSGTELMKDYVQEGGGEVLFQEQTHQVIISDHSRTLLHYALFTDLLQEQGSLLGMDALWSLP